MAEKEYKYEHPDKPGVMVSRARVWQIEQRKKGKCPRCGGNRPKWKKGFCPKCDLKIARKKKKAA